MAEAALQAKAVETEAAREELARREAARTSLSGYIAYDGEFQPAPHQQLLIDVLEAAIAGREITAPIGRGSREEDGPTSRSGVPRRFFVFMPPGGAKSTYTSVKTPPHLLGRWAHRKPAILACSNTADLAADFGLKVKRLVEGAKHRRLFDQRLSADRKAAGRWDVKDSRGQVVGEYCCAGVGGTIAGRRADLALIDDPIRSREEAESHSARNKHWRWYLDDFETRLKPDAIVGFIMTRWHEDDLAGRILGRRDPVKPERIVAQQGFDFSTGWHKGFDGRWWYVICIPAEHVAGYPADPLGRAPGEFYWPGYYKPADMRALKAGDQRRWASLYQQRPAPESGSYFKREWFAKRYAYAPAHPRRGVEQELRFYGASDYATKEDAGDWSVHGIIGVDERQVIYPMDWWRGQTESDKWTKAEIELQRRWKPRYWGEEKGQIARAVAPFRRNMVKRAGVYVPRYPLPSSADKEVRARAFQGYAAQGLVIFPGGDAAPAWAEDVIDWLVKFPNGAVDDDVDVLSLFGRMLDALLGPPPPAPEEEEPDFGHDGFFFSRLTFEQLRDANANPEERWDV